MPTIPLPNDLYMTRLAVASSRAQTYALGTPVVEPYGESGIVDAVFLTLEAAIAQASIPTDWYELQEKKPVTPKDGIWYSVVLRKGVVLVGQDDLRAVVMS